jgi:ABC-type dipeptide/oligopeptide/nickel transport system ATPase component
MVEMAKLDRSRKLDPLTENLVKDIKKTIADKNDDYMLFITGTTGSGKSMLSLHIYEVFAGDEVSIGAIGLNRNSHAKALDFASKQPRDCRFCIYDEANISRRSHAENYNKKLLNLYFQIRGLNIFHIWSNPSVNILEKPFIEERLKGLIYIHSKREPRVFSFFTKKALVDIMNKNKGKITHQVLAKNKDKALYKGWFFDYNGRLRQQYDSEKDNKMRQAIFEFSSEFSEEEEDFKANHYSKQQLANKLKVAYSTVTKHLQKKADILKEDVHYIYTPSGRKLYTNTCFDLLMNSLQRSIRNQRANLANLRNLDGFEKSDSRVVDDSVNSSDNKTNVKGDS